MAPQWLINHLTGVAHQSGAHHDAGEHTVDGRRPCAGPMATMAGVHEREGGQLGTQGKLTGRHTKADRKVSSSRRRRNWTAKSGGAEWGKVPWRAV